MLLVTCVDQRRGQDSEQIWAWDGAAWELVDGDGPEPVVVTGIAFDTGRNTLVRYGGLPLDSNACVRETWEWTEAAGWVAPPLVDTPPPAACDHIKLAYDEARAETLMFGGGQLQVLSPDTWSWDGAAWDPTANTGPAPRAHHELVYDAAHEQTLLYGGYDGTQVFDDFWSWDGSAWEELDFPGPGPRSHAAMAANPDGLLLFGGATGTSTFGTLTDDTWLLNDGVWTNLRIDGPSARGSAALAFDPDREVWVLYGGFGRDGGELGETWEFDGSNWSCVSGC